MGQLGDRGKPETRQERNRRLQGRRASCQDPASISAERMQGSEVGSCSHDQSD